MFSYLSPFNNCANQVTVLSVQSVGYDGLLSLSRGHLLFAFSYISSYAINITLILHIVNYILHYILYFLLFSCILRQNGK